MRRQRQVVLEGDVFLVPQLDGLYTVGQVLDRMLPHVASCAFYDLRADQNSAPFDEELPENNLVASLSVTSEALEHGRWRVVGRQSVLLDRRVWPNESCRGSGWVGAMIFDSEVAEDLLNAYFCLKPWDDWHDPLFLDSLLVSPLKKPHTLLFKRNQG
jgi:hypothetical protein